MADQPKRFRVHSHHNDEHVYKIEAPDSEAAKPEAVGAAYKQKSKLPPDADIILEQEDEEDKCCYVCTPGKPIAGSKLRARVTAPMPFDATGSANTQAAAAASDGCTSGSMAWMPPPAAATAASAAAAAAAGGGNTAGSMAGSSSGRMMGSSGTFVAHQLAKGAIKGRPKIDNYTRYPSRKPAAPVAAKGKQAAKSSSSSSAAYAIATGGTLYDDFCNIMHPQVYKYYNHLQVGVRNDMVQELWRQQCKVEKVTQQLLDASDYEESSRIKKRAYGQRTGCCCVALTQARAKHAHIF